MVHIYLIGPRCSGKSSVAKLLADWFKAGLVDGDTITNKILEEWGFPGGIGQVVAEPPSGLGKERGWAKMREAESQGIGDIATLYAAKDLIWAPGGGAVAHNQGEVYRNLNETILKSWGTGFYLIPVVHDLEWSAVELGYRVHTENVRNKGNSALQRPTLSVSTVNHPLLEAIEDIKRSLISSNRHAHYLRCADHLIETDGLTIEQVAGRIKEQVLQ